MGGTDLSKESKGLKMYISRNTGLLCNTDKSCYTLICFFRKRVSLHTQSQVHFIYAKSTGMIEEDFNRKK